MRGDWDSARAREQDHTTITSPSNCGIRLDRGERGGGQRVPSCGPLAHLQVRGPKQNGQVETAAIDQSGYFLGRCQPDSVASLASSVRRMRPLDWAGLTGDSQIISGNLMLSESL